MSLKNLFILHCRFKVWEDLGRDIFPSTLKFLKNECCSALLADVGQTVQAANQVNMGIQEMSTFLKILSALLDKVFLRDDFEKKQKAMESDGNAVSYLWGSALCTCLLLNFIHQKWTYIALATAYQWLKFFGVSMCQVTDIKTFKVKGERRQQENKHKKKTDKQQLAT